PELLASAIAILCPIEAATPSSAGGPVKGSTSPIRISVSVMPGSAAWALPKHSVPASNRDALVKNVLICLLPWCRLSLSITQRPVDPGSPDVVPDAHETAWLETQEKDDHQSVEHALQLLCAGREQRLDLRA